MSEKVSTLVLKVDLECCRCCKKIKKILCKFDEIRDQVYDEKQNTVTITGYFCPHKLKKKLCCKAGDIIKCIQIKEPEKPKPKPPKEPDPPPKAEPPKKQPEQPGRQTPIKTNTSDDPQSPVRSASRSKKPELHPKAPELSKKPEPPCPPAPSHGVCCRPCYEGYGGGPCYEGYGRPPPCYQGCGRPPPCYCDYERPPPCSCGCGGMRGYVSTCKFYFQEDPSTCIIM